MKRLSTVPNNTIRREQLRLYHQNLIPSVSAYTVLVLLITYVVYAWSNDLKIVYWAVAIVSLNLLSTYRVLFIFDDRIENARRVGSTETILSVINGVVFACLPIFFIPSASPEITMWIIFTSTGIAAGSVAMQSSWFPVFIGFNAVHMGALAISLYFRSEPVYHGLSVGVLLLFAMLALFTDKLQRTIRESIILRFQNDGLIRKLRLALTQTDEANRAKSVFLASASHDLRQPLHALGLLSETLGGTPMSEHQSKIQSHMMSAVDSTRIMLDSLLNISKLDAGAISSEPKPFLVQTLFNKLENELAPTADEHELIYRTRETIAAAHSDPFIVELILRNLIANAIRYTNKGGLLVACRARRNGRLILEVWDTGVGIPEEKIEDIFREFKQLDNPERDAQKGFGLGLAIAQGLARTIDSQIHVRSTEGRGTVFRFEIPASDADVIEDLPANNSRVDFKGKSILVIDDDRRIRASMQTLMVNWGCCCIVAESADEAIGLINGKPLDLLLVDYRLREGKTGREAIELIRAHCSVHIPAIIITGDTGTNRIIEAQSADALLLHKPASTTQLARMMRTLIGTQ